jgi:hypothetical protein
MTLKITYLSKGNLYYREGDHPSRLIESPFGKEVKDTALRLYQKHEWKMKGEESVFEKSILWGMTQPGSKDALVYIAAVTGGGSEEELTYVLHTDRIGGLFLYNHKKNEEIRLFHNNQFRAGYLDRNPVTGELLCSRIMENGTANINLVQKGTNELQELTEGDSLDEAPSWIPGTKSQFVYQSAGIARNTQGVPIGIGHYAIQKLDFTKGEMIGLKEDSNFDFLLPRMDQSGNLYYVRRPYELLKSRSSVGKVIKDGILFPYRLIVSIIHFLNVFSMIFSRKPLITSQAPPIKDDEQERMMLLGRYIQLESKKLRESPKDEEASIVPSSWELRKCNPQNEEEVLAKGIVAYDLGMNGEIVYSNGRGLFFMDKGKPHLIYKEPLVTCIAIQE